MSGLNVPAFTHVMSTRASALLLLIARETSSADNAKNRIQLLLLNVALNQVTNISISLSNLQFNLINSNTGPSQNQKIRGARSNVVGIMCPPLLVEIGLTDIVP